MVLDPCRPTCRHPAAPAPSPPDRPRCATPRRPSWWSTPADRCTQSEPRRPRPLRHPRPRRRNRWFRGSPLHRGPTGSRSVRPDTTHVSTAPGEHDQHRTAGTVNVPRRRLTSWPDLDSEMRPTPAVPNVDPAGGLLPTPGADTAPRMSPPGSHRPVGSTGCFPPAPHRHPGADPSTQPPAEACATRRMGVAVSTSSGPGVTGQVQWMCGGGSRAECGAGSAVRSGPPKPPQRRANLAGAQVAAVIRDVDVFRGLQQP